MQSDAKQSHTEEEGANKMKDYKEIMSEAAAKNAEAEEKRLARDYDAQELAKIEAAIMRDNARQAYFAEVAPIIAEVLTRYNGKAYGPRTREKINDELRERAGIHVVIEDYDFTIITTAPRYNIFGYRGLNVCGKDGRAHFLNDNKINVEAFEGAKLIDCGAYCEDPAAQALKLAELYHRAKEAAAEFEAIAKEFNGIKASAINHMNSYITGVDIRIAAC